MAVRRALSRNVFGRSEEWSEQLSFGGFAEALVCLPLPTPTSLSATVATATTSQYNECQQS